MSPLAETSDGKFHETMILTYSIRKQVMLRPFALLSSSIGVEHDLCVLLPVLTVLLLMISCLFNSLDLFLNEKYIRAQ